MKRSVKNGILLLCAIAVVLTAHALRPSANRPKPVGTVAVRLDPDGQRRCYRDGVFCRDYSGLARDESGECWWYAVDGQVDGSRTGFAENDRGWWFVDHGRVDFDRNEVVEGSLDGVEGGWYVAGGQVQLDYSGLTDYTDSGVCRYVENGRAVPDYTGFARNARGWYYVENGRVDETRTGLIEGRIAGEEALWFVLDGRAQLSFYGFADAGADGKDWFVVYGRADPGFTGIAQTGEGCWFCRNGRIDRGCRDALSIDGSDWLVSEGRAEKVTTEEQRTCFRALRLVNDLTDESMTMEEKLRVCFDHLKTSYREYNPRIPNLQEPGWQIIYANDILAGDGGNCLSFAAAFAYLARAIGYEEVYACNSGNHGWAEVEGLIYDPEWSRHSGGYDYYGIEYSSGAGRSYERGLAGSDWPGRRDWVRVKL